MSLFRSLFRALVVTLALALGFAGFGAPSASAAPTASAQHIVKQLAALLPTNAAARVTERAGRAGIARVIDPSVYQCGPAETAGWLNREAEGLSAEDNEFLQTTAADMYPSLDVILFATPDDPFYAPSVDAKLMGRTLRGLERFWTPQLPDVSLYGIHSSMLLDAPRVARLLELVMELDPATAAQASELVLAYVGQSAGLQYGQSPLLSFGAFTAIPMVTGRPGNFIAMGDGLLTMYHELGFGDVAAPFVLAHEFAHSVQIAAGQYDVLPTTPEATRRLELMADAGAAYFSSHPRGMSMQAKRIAEFAVVAHSAGDCGFDSPGHHGTPLQRQRAALWAAGLQESSRPKSLILAFAKFLPAFEVALPGLVAPDA